MADRRLVAQSITRSGQVRQLVTQCGPFGALLFSWAITFVDDDSRLDGSAGQLRSLVFPRYPEVSEDQVAEMLAVMNDVELAVWYEVEGSPGERYLYFPRFTTHQTLREDRYGPSRLPAPPRWVPEQGHPYSKNDERKAKWRPGQQAVSDLRHEKPQRDLRKTSRVAKRPVQPMNTASLWDSATTAQPPRDQDATATRPERATSATTAQPIGAPAGTEDAPRPAAPRLDSTRLASSRLATAEPASSASGTDRSGRGREEPSHPDCQREGCGDAWFVHASGMGERGSWRGHRDEGGQVNDCLPCHKAGRVCVGYVDRAPAPSDEEPPIPDGEYPARRPQVDPEPVEDES